MIQQFTGIQHELPDHVAEFSRASRTLHRSHDLGVVFAFPSDKPKVRRVLAVSVKRLK